MMTARLTLDERSELEALRRLTQEQAEELQLWRAAKYTAPPECNYWRERFNLASAPALVLAELVALSPKAVSKERLLEAMAPAWQDRVDGPEPKIVDVRICQLRKRLAKTGFPGAIRTHWGFGYSLSSEAAAFLRPQAREKEA